MGIKIYTLNTLEPFEVQEEIDMTAMNMSAALNNNLRFFITHDSEGRRLWIAVDKVIALCADDPDPDKQ